MAFEAESLYLLAAKRLLGVSHTGNHRDPPNEPLASQVGIFAGQVIGEVVNTDPSAATNVEYVEAELQLLTGSNNKAYQAVFPAGYAGFFGAGAIGSPLSDYTVCIPNWVNPVKAESDDSGGYEAALYDNGVYVPPTSTEDWLWDPFAGLVTSEDDLGLSTTGTIGVYLYTGDFIRDILTTLETHATGDGSDHADVAQNTSDIATVGSALSTHISDTGNPHSVTAAQAGALPLAGGTMTGNIAMSGAQTVDGRDVSSDGSTLDTHVGSTANPHSVTKTQVGLGNVTNDAQLPLSGGTMSGNIAMAGAQTVDGRDVSADGTKLDGIESGADVTDTTNVTAALPVDDATSIIHKTGDATAKIRFDVDKVTTATTRVVNLPDGDIHLIPRAMGTYVQSPATGDLHRLGQVLVPCTIYQVNTLAHGSGSECTINIWKAAKNEPESTVTTNGTKIWTSAQTVNTTYDEETTINSPAVAADQKLWLEIIDEDGSGSTIPDSIEVDLVLRVD